jgi:hypothetical protein
MFINELNYYFICEFKNIYEYYFAFCSFSAKSKICRVKRLPNFKLSEHPAQINEEFPVVGNSPHVQSESCPLEHAFDTAREEDIEISEWKKAFSFPYTKIVTCKRS